MNKDIFVYGTLKRGHHNNLLLEDSRYIGTAKTEQKFMMVGVGFPHTFLSSDINKEEDDSFLTVMGEVYEVTNPEVLKRLDWLEGVDHKHYYHFVTSVVMEDGSDRQVTMYVTHPDNFGGHDSGEYLGTVVGDSYSW